MYGANWQRAFLLWKEVSFGKDMPPHLFQTLFQPLFGFIFLLHMGHSYFDKRIESPHGSGLGVVGRRWNRMRS